MVKAPSHSKVAAIVVTYNRLELLKECLAALYAQTYPLAKVYIIDNASSDGTQAWFEESSYAKNKVFEFVQLGKNVGGAGGFEAGMKHAMEQSYDWLWLMDDDSIAKRDALEKLISSESAKDDRIGVLSSKVTSIEGDILAMNRQHMFNSWNGDLTHVDLDKFKGEDFKVDCSSFVGFLVKTNIVKEVGYPIGKFFIHFDDLEYSLRITSNGNKIMVIPQSHIVHKLTLMRKPSDKYLYVEATELWKYYYGQRNEVWGLVRYINPWHRKIEFLARRFWWIIKWTNVMRTYDHSWLRVRLLWMSYFDALFNRLGKRIDPATFNRSLK